MTSVRGPEPPLNIDPTPIRRLAIARQRQIDKLSKDAPTSFLLNPDAMKQYPIAMEIIRFASLQYEYARERRKARQARQKIIDRLLKDAHRRD